MVTKQNLTSKFAIFALLVLAVFLGNLKFKQFKNQVEIEKKTQSLQQQADALQKKNEDLSQSLQYLNSPSFKERVARQQLNLKKDGEMVYGFTENGSSTSEGQIAVKTSNAKKWWDYFFTN